MLHSYTTAYVARLNYNASIVEILAQLGSTKEAVGTVSSFFFFAYGTVQLINGILSKKYNTCFSVAIALLGSGLVNFSFTFCSGIEEMKYLWLLNGVFQSILWSSLIKTLSRNLSYEMLPKAIMVMSTTVASGTLIAYSLAALFSLLSLKWNTIFYFSSSLAVLVSVFWFVGIGFVQKEKQTESVSSAAPKNKLKLTPAVVFTVLVILVSAICNGFIKDGIITWVPSILKENFGVSSSFSIIVTLLLPILAVFGSALVKFMHKREKNENVLNGIFYFGALVLIVLIMLTINLKSVSITLILFGGIALLMASVNNVITSIVPLYSRDKIDSGLAAGVLDTFCYVGSTLSIAFLGKIADTKGWNDVFLCILIFSALAFAVCLLSVIFKKRK